MIARIIWRFRTRAARKALNRDPAYRYLDRELAKARKRHAPSAKIQAEKRAVIHRALGMRS